MMIKTNLKTLVVLSVSAVFTLIPLSCGYADDATPVSTENSASTTDTKTTASTESAYSGLVNGVQGLPNSMARLCQMNASEMAEDRQKLEECFRIIGAKINAENSADRLDGVKLYEEIRLDQLSNLLSEATAKSAAQKENQEIQDRATEATDKVSTDHDMMNAVAYDMMYLAKTVDNMRDILAEEIKYDMITEISHIDGSIWLREIEKQKFLQEKQQKSQEENKQ